MPTTDVITPTKIHVSGERKTQIQQFADALGVYMSDAPGQLAKAIQDQGVPGVPIDGKSDCLAVVLDSQIPAEAAINMDHSFAVEWRGTSIKVSLPFVNGVTKNWSHNIAAEFADLIEGEANKV